MTLTPATNKQVPDNSILDLFNKQIYLGNAYIVPVTVSLSNTSETGVVLLENPSVSASSFPSGYKSLFVNLRRFTSSLQEVLINTYVNPTASSMSTKSTPLNLRPASPNTSVSNFYPNGQFSVSANGTLMSSIGCSASDSVMDDSLLIILDPGQSLLITATALVETTSLSADVSWYEI